MASKGLFISFEGSEGCGKSTQIALLADRFRSSGREVLALREPGGCPLGEKIRDLLKFDPAGEGMAAEAELLLFAASRAQLVREVIRPALERGVVVLCDRFLDSTTVYQGVARAIAPSAVAAVNSFATGGTLPEVTLLLDLEAVEGRRRAASRKGPADRMEREREEFYEAVRRGYLDLAAAESSRIAVIDASGDVKEVGEAVVAALAERLGGGIMAYSRQEALGLLGKALAEGRLGHAYLISGDEGSGPDEFANEFAGLFLGDGSIRVESDPDFHAIAPESKSRRILTDQIRSLEEAIHRTPEKGSRKVAVIRDADRMMPQAANAFLKTLEEPPAGSLLLLTTSLPEALLETIRSRCLAVVLRSEGEPPLGERGRRLAEAMQKILVPGGRADATAAFGLSRLFRDLLTEVREEAEERMDEELSAEKARFGKTTEGDWEAREDSLKAAAEADVLGERSRLLSVMGDHFAAELRRLVSAGGTGSGESRRLLRQLDALERLRTSLERGVQEALALEAGFLELMAVSRQD